MTTRLKAVIFAVAVLCAGIAAPARAYQTREATFLIETDTGRVLVSQNATDLRYPASLTKMMTLYMVFDALEQGDVTLDTMLVVSQKAAGSPKSRLNLKKNSKISVENAVLAMIIKSANDAAVVIAEGLGGSEAQFADRMTRVAHELGMKSTTFKNASGLHDVEQVTTARDMAVLSMALIQHFPHYYKLFSVKGFRYGKRYYGNHNLVARFYRGGDGLKTGYVDASGYHVVGSAVRDGKRLIGVVMGRNSVRERDRQIFKLLDTGFSMLNNAAEGARETVAPPLKNNNEIADTQMMRRMQIAQEKLREQIDSVASFEASLALYQAEEGDVLTKTAIVDWGRKKPRKNKRGGQ